MSGKSVPRRLATWAVTGAAAAIVVIDRGGIVRLWNPAAQALLGWPADEVVGGPVPSSVLGRAVDWPRLAARLVGPAVVTARCRSRRGDLIEVECRAGRDGDGRMVLVVTDATARRRAERRLRYQARHDQLTGLPNRAALTDTLADALAVGGSRTGLLMIDLDRFKEVNDTLGHAAGDVLLAQIGPRILTELGGGDTVARLGGDEFAVLLADVADAGVAEKVAGRILTGLHRSFPIGESRVDIAASIGVAVCPDHAADVAGLLAAADVAMYEAKDTAAGVIVHTGHPDGHDSTRIGLLGDLRRALDRDDELVVYYQPQVDLTREEVCGAEALIRWRHPDRGLLLPGEFVPVAETTGLITRITDYVLGRAIGQAAEWARAGTPIVVSVNLSARNLHDYTLPDRVERLLERYGLAAGLLCLEITETAVMHDPKAALSILDRLAGAGIKLSVDDFGTGYSAMNYLRKLPVRELKIDKTFIDDLSAGGDTLVRSTIDLGHGMNMTVVAEGTETAESVAALHALGCDVAQGYFYARPMPADAVTGWMRTYGRAAQVGR